MSALRVFLAAALAFAVAACASGEGVRPARSVRVLWRSATGGFVDCAPAFSGDTVFVGSWDRTFRAIGLHDGAARWSVDAGDFVDAPPLVDGDGVVFCAWNRLVRRLDARDGRELWRFEMPPSTVDDHRQAGPAVAGKLLLVGGFDGVLYALDRETGRKAWALPTGGAIRGRPDPAGYVGSGDGLVYAFDPATGAVRWRRDTGGVVNGTPASAGGRVWVGCRSGRLLCLDAATGEVAWSVGAGSRIEYSSPLLVQGLVVVGDCDGVLHAFRQADGLPAWIYRAGAPIYASPVSSGGAIAVGDNGGAVHFVDPADGRGIARFRAGGPVQAVAPGPDGSVLCGSRDGFVYRLTLEREGS